MTHQLALEREITSRKVNLHALEIVFRNSVKHFFLAAVTCSFSREVAGIGPMQHKGRVQRQSPVRVMTSIIAQDNWSLNASTNNTPSISIQCTHPIQFWELWKCYHRMNWGGTYPSY